MEGEVKERRKIQFSVPSAVPTQLDPKQVEMIRRRRPTPATLFRLTDHPSPEEENPSHQLAVCENGLLKAKRVNTAVYQPPSLKAVQKMAEAHLQSSETGRDSPSSECSDNEEAPADADRNLPDDTRSDQSEHHSAPEVTDEDTGSTVLHDTPGEDDGAPAESRGGKDKSAENADSPDDTRSDQPEHHSASEVTDEVTGSTVPRDLPGEDDEAESKEEPDKSAKDKDNGECKEKGEV
ncbi:protein phosphatase 1 regulatory subunit 1B [Pygocentrus nattereri]|uniref:Protein phosphatase 1 regulatory subunit 1B n=1 Tax=Pygocentrus nattereri TaxID=42514 RepID=A0AAR2KBA2_PYGNA|nr:protein phosphatase 1 regulatory subunit 1B [Pygocentrus nattereri]